MLVLKGEKLVSRFIIDPLHMQVTSITVYLGTYLVV